MAGGVYNLTELPIRPGIYMNFVAAALAEIQGGPRGTVGLPITADWGPIGTFETVTDEKTLKDIFFGGKDVELALRCLKAGKNFKPTKIIVRRIAGTSAAKAKLVLEPFTITARYEGTHGNDIKITIQTNIVDSTKMDFKVLVGAALFKTYSIDPKDEDTIKAFIAEINGDDGRLVDVTLKSEAPYTVSAAASQPLIGGDSGLSLTADDYLNVLTAYEGVFINVFTLPGVTDPAILSSVMVWTKRLRDTGRKLLLVIGGTAEDDKDILKGNQRSKSADHEGIINVVVGTVVRGTHYSSAETACQIAGLVAGVPINKSTTYKALEDVDDVEPKLTDDEIKAGIRGGSFMLVAETDIITGSTTYKVEVGINTLTAYGGTKNERFSKIRTIRTLDAISDDITRTASSQYIGELNNDDDGRTALICAIKQYLETLANARAISPDFISDVSKYIESTGDKVFLNTDVMPIDSIERIFNAISVK